MVKRNLQVNPYIVMKCLELYKSKGIRISSMIIGQTLSGKTTVYSILIDALNQLS